MAVTLGGFICALSDITDDIGMMGLCGQFRTCLAGFGPRMRRDVAHVVFDWVSMRPARYHDARTRPGTTAMFRASIHRPWKLSEFKEIVTRWQRFERDAGFWNACVLPTNARHKSSDWFVQRVYREPRPGKIDFSVGQRFREMASRLGKAARGAWGDSWRDAYHEILEKRKRESGKDEVDMNDILTKKARDHGRVPMQWNSSAHAGFTTGTPWMRVNEDYETWNAASQVDDERSVRALWKRALQLRKDHKVLIYGDFTILAPENEEVFVYTRSYKNARALIVLNFTSRQVAFALPQGEDWSKLGLAFGNYTKIPMVRE
ncbi:hypothetical protein B0H13DRAFT_2290630 [Mycena leptocephala]|nr:hypothetical protein B0H13DRAFT_2290630 [Mycena leptocephala]